MTEKHTDPDFGSPELGPIANRVVFEDDRIRIWEMELEPGADSGPHEHEHDYVVIQIEGDRMALREHRTPTGTDPEYRESTVVPGSVFVLPKGGIETAINVGVRRYRDIEIEFLS